MDRSPTARELRHTIGQHVFHLFRRDTQFRRVVGNNFNPVTSELARAIILNSTLHYLATLPIQKAESGADEMWPNDDSMHRRSRKECGLEMRWKCHIHRIRRQEAMSRPHFVSYTCSPCACNHVSPHNVGVK
jgi:hypothetical protein